MDIRYLEKEDLQDSNFFATEGLAALKAYNALLADQDAPAFAVDMLNLGDGEDPIENLFGVTMGMFFDLFGRSMDTGTGLEFGAMMHNLLYSIFYSTEMSITKQATPELIALKETMMAEAREKGLTPRTLAEECDGIDFWLEMNLAFDAYKTKMDVEIGKRIANTIFVVAGENEAKEDE